MHISGTFGYELDLNRLTREEQEEVREQIRFMKEYREILQYGTFYRLESPFEGNVTGWMSVSEDKENGSCGLVPGSEQCESTVYKNASYGSGTGILL